MGAHTNGGLRVALSAASHELLSPVSRPGSHRNSNNKLKISLLWNVCERNAPWESPIISLYTGWCLILCSEWPLTFIMWLDEGILTSDSGEGSEGTPDVLWSHESWCGPAHIVEEGVVERQGKTDSNWRENRGRYNWKARNNTSVLKTYE